MARRVLIIEVIDRHSPFPAMIFSGRGLSRCKWAWIVLGWDGSKTGKPRLAAKTVKEPLSRAIGLPSPRFAEEATTWRALSELGGFQAGSGLAFGSTAPGPEGFVVSCQFRAVRAESG